MNAHEYDESHENSISDFESTEKDLNQAGD